MVANLEKSVADDGFQDVQSPQPFEKSSAESQPGNSDSGFNNIMQNIKVKVLKMVSNATHHTKIISHVIKRLKDNDSSVRDACRDAIGSLSNLYLKSSNGNNGNESVVGLFVRPLFEAMGEQNKGVQSGAAMCMAKMVECASEPPVSAFQKLCPRICRLLNNPNFLAKAALLPVVASLSQV